jgi:hypothetical protein
MDLRPSGRVLSYFDDENLASTVAALRTYFGPNHHYTGAAFDDLIAESPPDEYTCADIVAVSMLSVTVPARASLALLGGAANDLLESIPSNATVWSNPELLDRGSDAWTLWNLVNSYNDIGRTKTSKILAAKRPGLVPVYDQYVAAALGFGKNYWAFWQDVASEATHVGGGDLPVLVDRARSDAGVPEHVSALRIIDAVVWMRHHGWKTHTNGCKLGCDVSSFAIR